MNFLELDEAQTLMEAVRYNSSVQPAKAQELVSNFVRKMGSEMLKSQREYVYKLVTMCCERAYQAAISDAIKVIEEKGAIAYDEETNIATIRFEDGPMLEDMFAAWKAKHLGTFEEWIREEGEADG